MSDGSEYVSNHDRGRLGSLAEARSWVPLAWSSSLAWNADAENDERWSVSAGHPVGDRMAEAYGRTGEEALRQARREAPHCARGKVNVECTPTASKRLATSNAYWLSPKDRDKADHDQQRGAAQETMTVPLALLSLHSTSQRCVVSGDACRRHRARAGSECTP